MTDETKAPSPKHLLVREPGQLGRIACGAKVAAGQFTDEPLKASCKRCAKDAPGLEDGLREEIWENANDRLGKTDPRPNPWERARRKAARKARAAAKAAGGAA